ncbi:hypothetical protein CGZ93_17825 [Enemella dayhoffiae]|uniref:Uncharacterized protein n=1 Tax=Enemella dayhoffiae TaxID=2016507 RepID=A0A255GLC7_9ACTN|nr:hypothetical protein [Enemella dayhoffiae]OYO16619.1 hypothetical protein CGZ93_17825 [Enemella dayhoffiae]
MSEPLPEYVHQTLPIARLKKAIEQIEMAERQDDPQVKLELLRAADDSCMYARRSAESLMAMWRGLNERAEELRRRLDDEARAGRPGQDSLFEEAS